MNKEIIEQSAFEIISYAGGAKALFLEAVDYICDFEFEKAQKCIKQGQEILAQSHESHYKLITMEANDSLEKTSLLLIHAEDQFMSAENSLVLAQKLLKVMQTIEKKLNMKG
ncbi:PTS lactose/cellobiose transporter subunit IIA [Mycoplasmopsis ciconiae]|uniref:PTS lactose/cellobiose transporter subunit IIA n=1 Tax=Mycoplasmopsis ciconiae TaxID=561067 RepID=A0ABU7ML95_9BACT|nr:PTS lactose/cellobiose transporter subunit IIA [Mycoplasmopsis ciconiae]